MGVVVVGVAFDSNPKVYYFDPKDIEVKAGDNVVVETVRGLECGTISFPNKVVPDDSIVGEIKPILRKATEEDIKKHKNNIAEKPKILKTIVESVRKHKLDMKVLGSDYTLDRGRLIIYFTAENRVDFRELVKDLAGQFRTRIEMRQIYERDSIKMFGALASCGRECCCASFLKDYEKTTIKMVKGQDLSLNPASINGFCGKLMCCLRFENEHYENVGKNMPKYGSLVNTPMGRGKVCATKTLIEKVRVRFFDDNDASAAKEHDFDISEVTLVKDDKAKK